MAFFGSYITPEDRLGKFAGGVESDGGSICRARLSSGLEFPIGPLGRQVDFIRGRERSEPGKRDAIEFVRFGLPNKIFGSVY